MHKLLVGLPIAVVVVVFVLMVTPLLGTCGGADEAVTATLRQCERATKLIGKDAHPARMGFACGSTKISGSDGTSSWSLPYTGDTGRGTVSYNAVKENDEWKIRAAELEIGDETIDLVACAGPTSTIASTNRLTATFDGTVTTSTHDAVHAGMMCKGSIERPAHADLADTVVTCLDSPTAGEGTVVYRGRAPLKVDPRGPGKGDEWLLYLDEKGPVNAKVEFDGPAATLRVWSQSPAWEIVADLSDKPQN